MSATTTAICVIVMGTAGGTIRAPLPLAIRYLLGCSQLGAEQVQVPGRVDPVEDGAAAACRTSPSAHSTQDRKSTRLNSSHSQISYAVFCLKKKTTHIYT